MGLISFPMVLLSATRAMRDVMRSSDVVVGVVREVVAHREDDREIDRAANPGERRKKLLLLVLQLVCRVTISMILKITTLTRKSATLIAAVD